MNKKTITIALLLTVILVGIILYKIIPTNKNTQSIQSQNNTKDTGSFFEIFDSKNNNNQTNTIQETDKKIIIPKDSPEKIISLQIEKNLKLWNATRDTDSLESALLLSYNSSNESLFEPWKDSIVNNSSDLFILLNKEPKKESLLAAYSIFDWFINLSGEYQKLTKEKRQQIYRDFMQVQVLLNTK